MLTAVVAEESERAGEGRIEECHTKWKRMWQDRGVGDPVKLLKLKAKVATQQRQRQKANAAKPKETKLKHQSGQ